MKCTIRFLICNVTNATFVSSYRQIGRIEKADITVAAVKRKLAWHCFLTTRKILFYLYLFLLQGLQPTIWKESLPLFHFILANSWKLYDFKTTIHEEGKERALSSAPLASGLCVSSSLELRAAERCCDAGETQDPSADMPDLCNHCAQNDYLLVNYCF